ncbi:MAG: succinylglutamate desuccinylase/aspartoacylase family protein [Candidatus Hodarchaeales archaeon]|jgi:predicted deacylase
MKEIEIGNAKAESGKLIYGFIESLNHPTDMIEKVPVMIAQGRENGPTFFLTANVHGNELTGIAVIHQLVTDKLAQELKGTIVAIPTLNPSALRRNHRSPGFDERDPNRLYPEGKFAEEKEEEEIDKDYPELYEQVANKIYSYFEKYADYHIDFHNHSLRSIPYVILDRVFYENEAKKEEAEKLSKQQKAMVEAFGVLACSEFPAKKYLKMKLHRSVSGATLNSLRIPAFTAELGENSVIIPQVVEGSIKGTRNVLKWAGMLEGPREEITEFLVPKPNEQLRRCYHPRSKQSGIIRFLINPGDQVKKGQPVALITDILGRQLGDGYIRTEYDGYMIALRSEMTVYPNDPIAEMGIKDDAPIVVPIKSKKRD